MKRIVSCPIIPLFGLALACGGSGSSSPPVVSNISIDPATANILVHQTVQFTISDSTGMSSPPVTWSVQEDKGGAVSSGLYQAPSAVGTYHVTAAAVADPTKTATATVTVTAATAFLETLPGGTSTPWSLTPVIGTLREDGTWETAGVIDPLTSSPMDTSFYDISLSGDGTRLVSSVPQLDSQGHVAWNIVMFNADGSGLTSLTHNVPDPNLAATGDLNPQLSPNGQFIVYSHDGGGGFLQIWIMNSDGTSPHIVSSTSCSFCVEAFDRHASFSPDGSKVVYDYWERIDLNLASDGIATANADGTGGETYLTINDEFFVQPFLDTRPTFINDGSEIAFTRDNYVGSVTVQIMDADGSAVRPLYDPGIQGAIALQPRAFADRILFSTNVDLPGSNSFDIYSIMPDGSGLTRLTNNLIYDGFDESELNYPAGGQLPD